MIVDTRDENLSRAFRNLSGVALADAAGVKAWQIMAARKVYVTKAALEYIEKRWPKG